MAISAVCQTPHGEPFLLPGGRSPPPRSSLTMFLFFSGPCDSAHSSRWLPALPASSAGVLRPPCVQRSSNQKHVAAQSRAPPPSALQYEDGRQQTAGVAGPCTVSPYTVPLSQPRDPHTPPSASSMPRRCHPGVPQGLVKEQSPVLSPCHPLGLVTLGNLLSEPRGSNRDTDIAWGRREGCQTRYRLPSAVNCFCTAPPPKLAC